MTTKELLIAALEDAPESIMRDTLNYVQQLKRTAEIEAESLNSEALDAIERSHPAYEPIMTRLLEEAFQEDPGTEIIQKGEVRDWLASVLD